MLEEDRMDYEEANIIWRRRSEWCNCCLLRKCNTGPITAYIQETRTQKLAMTLTITTTEYESLFTQHSKQKWMEFQLWTPTFPLSFWGWNDKILNASNLCNKRIKYVLFQPKWNCTKRLVMFLHPEFLLSTSSMSKEWVQRFLLM